MANVATIWNRPKWWLRSLNMRKVPANAPTARNTQRKIAQNAPTGRSTPASRPPQSANISNCVHAGCHAEGGHALFQMFMHLAHRRRQKSSRDTPRLLGHGGDVLTDRKSTRLNSSHLGISY